MYADHRDQLAKSEAKLPERIKNVDLAADFYLKHHGQGKKDKSDQLAYIQTWCLNNPANKTLQRQLKGSEDILQ